MEVHALGWIALAAIILAMITIDIVGHVRTPHEPTLKEAAWWSVGYIALAVIFGAIVWGVWGGQYGQEYFAGYITEKALSVDNLFVFVIMISSFRVPRKYQQEVLLAGIVIALVLRLVFILLGAALIENFSWVFYLFGAWLLWTAFSQAREGVQEPDHHSEEYEPSGFVRLISRVVPMTDGFVGGKVIHRHAGRTMITPMLLCIIAIGTADVMFAIDSIPAIYSLTAEPYLVFAANAFSLLQAGQPRPAHQRAALHQRRAALGADPRAVHRGVPGLHRRRHHHHRARLPRGLPTRGVLPGDHPWSGAAALLRKDLLP